ncbi:reverse transcriptase [Phytophthora cinnamomi]|uniref:reverse transcriptase n=1 Tax=Phytophthora cinnamomi TaxID=4785 RepID=UPI0035599F3E|nr:reverse transcriptase [Phytophthora cinnamomi]
MSWKRFTRDLHDGRIEQVCVLSDSERTESESEELRQLFMGSTTESEDALSAKTKRERFEEQEIPAELPQDKGIQHEIDLVPGTKYCVTRQWPLPREQVKAIDDFFESRRKAGQVRESKSPHSAPTFCVKKPQGGWRIVHAYNKLNDATVPAQTPIPRKDVIIDSMAGSTVYSALDLRDGFYQLCGAGLRTTRRRRKRKTLRKSRSGTETQQEQSAGQTAAETPNVKTLSVFTRTDTGFQYREMELASPPTTASELTSLPAMSWKRFTRDLHDGRIEQSAFFGQRKNGERERRAEAALHGKYH